MTTKLRAASFQDGAVTTTKIAADAITNAKIADDAVQTENVASTVNLGRRNIIINGAMQVSERDTSQGGISSAGYYTIDRFKINTNDAGVWTMSQEALSSSDTPFTEGFGKALKLDCTTSATPASNGTLQVQYSIEGQDLQQLASGTSSAKTLILSFWIKATKTGTNVLGGYQDDGGKSFGLTYTINSSNTWEYKTITIPANTADVIANDATRGRIVTWYFSAGTDRTTGTLRSTWTTYVTADESVGQVNHADNTANNIHITGVQLEVGSQATPFEHRSFAEEIALCRRYFYKPSLALRIVSTLLRPDNKRVFQVMFPVDMRTAPTADVTYDNDGSSATLDTPTVSTDMLRANTSALSTSNRDPRFTAFKMDAEL